MVLNAASATKFQVHQEIAPVVLAVISCLVPILQNAEVRRLLYSDLLSFLAQFFF